MDNRHKMMFCSIFQLAASEFGKMQTVIAKYQISWTRCIPEGPA